MPKKAAVAKFSSPINSTKRRLVAMTAATLIHTTRLPI